MINKKISKINEVYITPNIPKEIIIYEGIGTSKDRIKYINDLKATVWPHYIVDENDIVQIVEDTNGVQYFDDFGNLYKNVIIIEVFGKDIKKVIETKLKELVDLKSKEYNVNIIKK